MSSDSEGAPPPTSVGMPSAGHLPRTRLTHVLITGVLLLGGMLLGLATQALIAYFFGASARSDALFLARDSAELFAKLLLGAQAAGVLTPMYLSLRVRHGDEQAWKATGAVMTLILVAAVPLGALVALAAPLLVAVVAPGFDEPTADLTVDLLRILGPTATAVATGGVAVTMLQARERFGRAMGTNVVGGAVAFGTMALLVPAVGVRGAASALLLGAVTQAVMAWILLVRTGMPPLVAPWKHRPVVAEFLHRLAPFLGSAGAVQLSGIVLRASASTLATGLYSALVLGQRLYRAVVSLLLAPVQMVLLPALARQEASGPPGSSRNELFATLRYVLALVVPIAACLVILRGEAVSVAFQRGEFSSADAEATATALGFFAFALVPVGLYLMLEQAGYAQRRTRLVVGVNVGLEATQAALYFPLTQLIGVRGIPLAVAVATSLATVAYLRLLHPDEWRAALLGDGFGARLIGATAAMVGATVGVVAILHRTVDPPPGLAQSLVAVPATVAGAAVYVIAATALGLQEPARLGALLKARGRDALAGRSGAVR